MGKTEMEREPASLPAPHGAEPLSLARWASDFFSATRSALRRRKGGGALSGRPRPDRRGSCEWRCPVPRAGPPVVETTCGTM